HNLCDNAMKYGSAEGGHQTKVILRLGQWVTPEIDALDQTGESTQQTAVRAGADISELVWLQVQDNGGGIDRNDLPRLTERFYRVNPQLSRSMGGTGLGLAIVKHILQRHQGGLQIASTPNEGATFMCVFPLARSKATPPRLEKEAS
ncbi:MAG: ATP-binding protein, partial [Pseudomonadota bacterium]